MRESFENHSPLLRMSAGMNQQGVHSRSNALH